MKILICSDGTQSAETAIHLGGLLAGPLKAETTLLGIADTSQDEQALRDALHKQAQLPRSRGVSPAIVVQSGEPVRQILDQTSKTSYELVAVGARWVPRRKATCVSCRQASALATLGNVLRIGLRSRADQTCA